MSVCLCPSVLVYHGQYIKLNQLMFCFCFSKYVGISQVLKIQINSLSSLKVSANSCLLCRSLMPSCILHQYLPFWNLFIYLLQFFQFNFTYFCKLNTPEKAVFLLCLMFLKRKPFKAVFHVKKISIKMFVNNNQPALVQSICILSFSLPSDWETRARW